MASRRLRFKQPGGIKLVVEKPGGIKMASRRLRFKQPGGIKMASRWLRFKATDADPFTILVVFKLAVSGSVVVLLRLRKDLTLDACAKAYAVVTGGKDMVKHSVIKLFAGRRNFCGSEQLREFVRT